VTDLAGVAPVLEQAERLAAALGGQVVLVHAVGGASAQVSQALARAQASCEAAAARSPRISRTFVLRFDDPVHLLAVSAAELGPEVVVVGAEGGFGPVVRGALRECPVPLWLARGEEPIRRLAGAVGGPLVDRLARGLRLPRVLDGEARPGDLQVLDTEGLSSLSRLHRVQEAARTPGPLLVLPSSRRPTAAPGNVR
jgi:hypothetical protein